MDSWPLWTSALKPTVKVVMVSVFRHYSQGCKKKRPLAASYLSVSSSAYNNWAPRWKDFHEILNLYISRKSVENFEIWRKSDKNSGHLTWKFMCIRDGVSLNSSRNEKCFRLCTQNRNKHFMFSNVPAKIVPFMNNVEGYGTARQVKDDNIIWPLRVACRITKATDAHSEYVIFIASPKRQR